MTLQELFSSEDKWTQEAEARNAAFRPVKPNDPEAVCWCLEGGIRLCYPDNFFEIRDKLRDLINNDLLFEWNDHPNRIFQQVYELIVEANV